MKYIDAELIQKEIERQIMGIIKKQDANPDMPKYRWYLYEGMKEAFNDIGDFLDTLPDEPVTTCDQLTEAAEKYGSDYPAYNDDQFIAENAFKAGAEWGANHLRDTTEKVPEDLEEAAETKYPTRWKKYPNDGIVRSEEYFDLNAEKRDAFIAGAEWQKRKMMEGAVEGEVCILPGYVAYVNEKNNESLKQYLLDNFKDADNVKIIIVKEEER